MPAVGEKEVKTKCSVMEEIEQLRSVVRNAMHFTMVYLSNPLHRRMCGFVIIFTSRVQEWHHKQAETPKTASMKRSWVVEQLRGAFMQLLESTMQLLVTEHVLEDLGFLTKSRACSCRPSLNARFFGVLGCCSGTRYQVLAELKAHYET